jgi:hypothetical protein
VIRNEVQIRLKEKVYIHTRATIKGEEVDICARKTISPSDRGYCCCETEHITQHHRSLVLIIRHINKVTSKKKLGSKVLTKPRPEPAALAFSYFEPGQSRCSAVTIGLAWPGRNRLSLARLTALGRARQITKQIMSGPQAPSESSILDVLSVPD